MSEAAGLRALQDAMLRRILATGEPAPQSPPGLFVDPPQGTIEARWHIYTHGCVVRVVEAIENDYPALSRVLGARALRSLTTRYLARFPPRSHDLGRVGDRLAAFLEDDVLTHELPFLPDLGRLEWAVAEAFVAEDGKDLPWDDLARFGAEAVSERPLRIRPGAARIRSPWPIHDIWKCREQPVAEVDVAVHGRPCSVLVSRRGLDVICRPLRPLEDRVLDLAAHGGRLTDLEEEADEIAADTVAAFRALVEDCVFAWPVDGSPLAG